MLHLHLNKLKLSAWGLMQFFYRWSWCFASFQTCLSLGWYLYRGTWYWVWKASSVTWGNRPNWAVSNEGDQISVGPQLDHEPWKSVFVNKTWISGTNYEMLSFSLRSITSWKFKPRNRFFSFRQSSTSLCGRGWESRAHSIILSVTIVVRGSFQSA